MSPTRSYLCQQAVGRRPSDGLSPVLDQRGSTSEILDPPRGAPRTTLAVRYNAPIARNPLIWSVAAMNLTTEEWKKVPQRAL